MGLCGNLSISLAKICLLSHAFIGIILLYLDCFLLCKTNAGVQNELRLGPCVHLLPDLVDLFYSEVDTSIFLNDLPVTCAQATNFTPLL